MLIVFNKSTGEVVESQSINGLPLGPTEKEPIILNVVARFGGTSDDYRVLRLHDEKDAEMVIRTFTHEYTIQNGEIVFGAEKVIPKPEPQPPSEMDILAEELVKMKFENMQKDTVISTFGEEITKLKLEMMILKGGA